MAEMPPDERQRFLEVLSDWHFAGYVIWEKDAIRQLERLDGQTMASVNQILLEYVLTGGEIRKQREDREPWKDTWTHHYDLFPIINDREIFVETRFDEHRKDYPTIRVVHLHPPGSHTWN